MANNRLDRELETRTKTVRKTAWTRPTVLPDPIPEDGYTYHWVRIATNGQSDATNISSKIREGWEPVRAQDHPEIFTDSVSDERFKDNVIVGGLMYQAESQIHSVDNNLMRENDPRMPLFHDRKTKVTFGSGN
jgi:hypothetical protein